MSLKETLKARKEWIVKENQESEKAIIREERNISLNKEAIKINKEEIGEIDKIIYMLNPSKDK